MHGIMSLAAVSTVMVVAGFFIQMYVVSPTKVIVIGAGFAGLSAARELSARGYDVHVVEAKGHAGGRIVTHYDWGGAPTEIGATFIHGVAGNPVAALARECGEPIVAVDYDSIVVHGHDGRPFTSDDFHRVKAEHYDPVRKAVMAARDRRHRDVDLQTAFEEARRDLKLAAPTAVDRDLLSWHFFWEIVQDQIAQVGQLSTIEYDASTAYDGADYIIKSGMASLVRCLKSMAPATYTFDAPVRTIDTTRGEGVTVFLKDGGQMSASFVVVTVPLGVLQRGLVSFQPPLPRWKRRAIHRLGCAATLKVGLRWAAPFWPRVQFFGKVGRAECPEGVPVCYGDGDLMEFVNLDYHHGNGVLVAELDGEYAAAALATGNVTAVLMAELRLMFGEGTPWPSDVRVNDYVNDPAIGGCGFSFWPPFTSGDDNTDVAAPVAGGRVHFAGEHTTPEYYANLHGALLEGAAVAARVALEDSWRRRALGLWQAAWGGGSRKERDRAHFKPKWCPAPCQN